MNNKQIISWCITIVLITNSLTSGLVHSRPSRHRIAREAKPDNTNDWQPMAMPMTVSQNSHVEVIRPVYQPNVHHQRVGEDRKLHKFDENTRSLNDAITAESRKYSSVISERKFAEKPNAVKKVAIDDVDTDLDSNSISDVGNANGFSWSGVLGTIMQMLFNGGGLQGPNKSEGIDGEQPISPWANLITFGLKLISAMFGVGNPVDNNNIDKVDNEASPMQNILATVLSAVLGARDPDQVATIAKQAGEFISIVVNLLDTLKTSFSHRSMAARSLGKKDSVSDATIASITMLKGYMRTLSTSDDQCMQMYVCEANRECVNDVGPSSIFCQFGTYAASYILEKSVNTTFDKIYEAGRRGRSGNNCKQAYHECNEV